MKNRAFEMQRLSQFSNALFTGAKCPEILSRFRNDVVIELKKNTFYNSRQMTGSLES